MKFRSDVGGVVTGVRFYKSAANTGTHIGNLWTATGTLLGSVAFNAESASGWQQTNFTAPIVISPNTTYIISYFAPSGHYSTTAGFFASGADSPRLHALATGIDGSNGVYSYGSASSFPVSTFNNNNHWVDVVFTDNAPPVISAVYDGATNFSGSTSSVMTQTVNPPSTTTVLMSNLNPSVYGQSVTLKAVVSPVSPGTGTPTGTVTFKDGSTVIGTAALSGGLRSRRYPV